MYECSEIFVKWLVGREEPTNRAWCTWVFAHRESIPGYHCPMRHELDSVLAMEALPVSLKQPKDAFAQTDFYLQYGNGKLVGLRRHHPRRCMVQFWL